MPESEILSSALSTGDWVRAGAIVVASVVVAVIANRVVRHIIRSWIGPGFAALLTARLISYVVFLVGLTYALNSLGVKVGPLLGALGLGGIVLALALQKPVENFVAAITLQTLRPFTIGDTISIGEHLGVVLDIDSRVTVMRGDGGTIISIPNSNVTADTTINLTREPTRRSTVIVGVAYDTDLDAATEAIRTAIARVTRVVDDQPAMVVLSDFASSSIEFKVLFWHLSDRPSERLARHDVMLAVHQALNQAGITIAFPQMVVWSGESNGPAWSRASSTFANAASPTPLIAPRPYKTVFSSTTEKRTAERLISGGCTVSPMTLHSSIRPTTFSVLSISADMTADMNAAG